MSLHAALLALQEKDADGNRLGWRTGTTEHALINTETTSVAVLALGANASWVLEPGHVPLRSAPGNYTHEHETLSAVAGQSVPGYIVFGPFWALEPGSYDVEFALRSPAARVESPLATIEVYDGSAVVAVKVIEGADAPIGNQWHRYRLAAEVGNASNLAEFRVFWHGAYDLDVGSIRVTQPSSDRTAAGGGRVVAGGRCSLERRPSWGALHRRRVRACLGGPVPAQLRLTSNICAKCLLCPPRAPL